MKFYFFQIKMFQILFMLSITIIFHQILNDQFFFVLQLFYLGLLVIFKTPIFGKWKSLRYIITFLVISNQSIFSKFFLMDKTTRFQVVKTTKIFLSSQTNFTVVPPVYKYFKFSMIKQVFFYYTVYTIVVYTIVVNRYPYFGLTYFYI